MNHLEGGFAPTTSSPIQGCSGVGPAPAAAFAGTSSAGADGRHRDLLPMPLPPASARNSGTVTRCRAVRRRSERVAHGEFLVTEVVKTLNEMYTGQDGPHTQDAVPPTAAQSQAVSAIRAAVHRFGQPPEDLSGAGALGELRVQAVCGGVSAVLAAQEPLVSSACRQYMAVNLPYWPLSASRASIVSPSLYSIHSLLL